jgi:hypothetical protein
VLTLPDLRHCAVFTRCRLALLKAKDGFSLVAVNIKEGQQLCRLHQVAKRFREIEELDATTVFAHGDVSGNQFAQSAGIDVGYTCQIQDNMIAAFIKQRLDRFRQGDGAAAKPQTDSAFAIRIQDRDAADLALFDTNVTH